MNRLIVLTLVLVLTLSVSSSGLLAAGPAQTPTQTQNQARSGDCVCDGPNCDPDCPQNCYQYQNGNSYQGDVPHDEWDWIMFMLQYQFGGGD